MASRAANNANCTNGTNDPVLTRPELNIDWVNCAFGAETWVSTHHGLGFVISYERQYVN